LEKNLSHQHLQPWQAVVNIFCLLLPVVDIIRRNCEFSLHSDEGTAAEKAKKKKVKRKKHHKSDLPHLTVLNVQTDEGEQMVECRMETDKTVTFQFNLEDDQPKDIAENLVSYDHDISAG
jgi:hypothetical protein